MALNIDGDGIVYMAGFGADSRNGDLSHSLHNAKLMIHSTMDKCGQDDCNILLTSKDPSVNFRHALYPIYKQNRVKVCKECKSKNIEQNSYVIRVESANGIMKRRVHDCSDCGNPVPSTKPVYYNKIRRYLVDRFGATVCDFGEADDWLLVGLKKKDFAASHDKDIAQGENCRFFNLKTNEILEPHKPGKLWIKQDINEITGHLKGAQLKGQGFKWFCAQMILGDSADNIKKPVLGDGPKWIHKIWEPLTTKREAWNMVKLYYLNTVGREQMVINGQLLWISRKPYQKFSEEVAEEFVEL